MIQRVKDVMRRGVITCPLDMLVGQVASNLVHHQIHAVFVEDEAGTIVGVISDFDLLTGEWLASDDDSLVALRSMRAGDMMTSPVHSVDVDEPLGPVASRMLSEHIHRLLVTRNSQPVGVISVSDMLTTLRARVVSPHTVRDVMSYVYVVCQLDSPLVSVARGMDERHTRSVLVIDSSGAPHGIITGLDMLALIGKEEGGKLLARDVMRAPVATISPAASLREAAETMISNHLHRLLVSDHNHEGAMPLGLVSTFDIMYEMALPSSRWQTA